MPIRYYAGVEGSGKTCMMTRDLILHYKAGGQVLSFPGYALFGNTKHQVLSRTLPPEQIITLLSDEQLKRQHIAIAIDEISNFFNHHTWWNKICDIMYAILAQRRKLGIALLMTGPQLYQVPPDIRNMVHEIVHCTDKHTLNHAIPRGLYCVYYKEDMRGLLSNPRHRFSKRKTFLMKPWYKYYDTFATVDALHQFTKFKVKGREVIVSADGRVLNKGQEKDIKINEIEQTLSYLKGRDMGIVPASVISKLLPDYHLKGPNGIGAILKSLGVKYIPVERAYDISGIS